MLFYTLIDRAHKAVGGASVLGEIYALATSDIGQQRFYLACTVLTFGSHFFWSQFDKRRKAKEQAKESERRARDHEHDSRRRKKLLDALADRYADDIGSGRPITYGDFVHLIADRVEVPAEDVEKGDAPIPGRPAPAAGN